MLNNSDILPLIERYLDGDLVSDDFDVLSSWLVAHQTNRDFFVRVATLHRQCRDWAMSESQLENITGGVTVSEESRLIDAQVWGELIDEVLEANRLNDVAVKSHKINEENQHQGGKADDEGLPEEKEPQKRVVVIPWAAAWGGLIAAAVALVFIFVNYWPANAPNVVSAPQAQPIVQSASVRDVSDDAVWSSAPPVDGALYQGDELELLNGMARLTMLDGTSVVLQSPVRFRVISRDSLFLIEGQLSARSLPGKTGFRIETRLGEITDLGTEFGVSVPKSGAVRTEVFEGKVSFVSKQSEGDSQSARQVNLEIGDAIRVVNEGDIEHVKATPYKYVRIPEFDAVLKSNESAYYRWLAYTYELRRDPDLLAFYGFDPDTITGRQTKNLAGLTEGRFNALMGDDREWTSPRSARDRFGQPQGALSFDRHLLQALYIDDWPEVGPLDALTITCWFKLGGDLGYWPLLVTQWDDYAEKQQSYGFHLGIRDSGKILREMGGGEIGLQAHVPLDGSVRRGQGWNAKDEPRAGSGIQPGDGWTHVALSIQCGGGKIRLYKNGVEIDTDVVKYKPKYLPVNSSPLVIGGKASYRGESSSTFKDSNLTGYFDGHIDDVALFRRALGAEEIRSLYEAGLALDF